MKVQNVTKNILMGVLIAVSMFSVFFVLSHFILKILFLTVLVCVGIMLLLPFVKFKRFFSLLLIGVLLCTTIFAIIEFNLLENTRIHSPLTSPPSTLLKLSLEQTVKSLENSATFAFLQLEYPGGLSLDSIELNSPVLGRVSVNYYVKQSNTQIVFYASDGEPYKVQTIQFNPSNIREDSDTGQLIVSLQQIDFLGLEWFYNQALNIVQNKTGSIPPVDALSISINNEEHNTHSGFTLTLIGYELYAIENEGLHGHSTLIASFQPNGTLIYTS